MAHGAGPDMAYWLFTDAILKGTGRFPSSARENCGATSPISTISSQHSCASWKRPFKSEGPGAAPHRIYNLGNSHPESVLDLIGAIEAATGKKAQIEHAEGPPGDVKETYADISRAARDFGFAPKVSLTEGIARFAAWFADYHKLK